MADKKMGIGTKLAIAGGVVGVGWLAWEFLIKPEVEDPIGKTQDDVKPSVNDVIDVASQVPVNTTPAVAKRKLSPLGTPTNKLNWSMLLYKGDKGGEVEALQRLFNRVSKINGTNILVVDGSWGGNTEAKKQKIIGTVEGINLAKALKAVEKFEAKKTGKVNPFFDYDKYIEATKTPSKTNSSTSFDPWNVGTWKP